MPETFHLRRIFEWLNQSGIPYAVLGNSEKIPENVDGDIDLVVDENHIRTLPTWFSDLCQSVGLLWVLSVQYKTTSFAMLVAWEDQEHHEFLKFDICSEYSTHGYRLGGSTDLLKHRTLNKQNGLFFVPASSASFQYYFLKKAVKQDIDSEGFAYLCQVAAELDPQKLEDLIGCYFPKEKAHSMADAIRKKDMSSFRSFLTIPHRLRFSPFRSIKDIHRRIRRWFHPVGMSVLFLGPDGSGKSSVVGGVSETFSRALPNVIACHFRPQWGRALNAPPRQGPLAPHQQKPRSQVMSMLKAVYYALDHRLSYELFIRYRLVKNALYVLDRGFEDMRVDPERYRMNCPQWFLRMVSRAIPKPDLTIVLTAPPNCLNARKQEVAPETIERLCTEYQRFAEKASAQTVDASKPLKSVVLEVERCILSKMQYRFQRDWMKGSGANKTRLTTDGTD